MSPQGATQQHKEYKSDSTLERSNFVQKAMRKM